MHQPGIVKPLRARKLEDAKPDRGLRDQQHPNSVGLGLDLQLHFFELAGAFQGGDALICFLFREGLPGMLLHKRQQLARIQIRTAGDLHRGHILAFVGRQDDLACGSCLGKLRGLLSYPARLTRYIGRAGSRAKGLFVFSQPWIEPSFENVPQTTQSTPSPHQMQEWRAAFDALQLGSRVSKSDQVQIRRPMESRPPVYQRSPV